MSDKNMKGFERFIESYQDVCRNKLPGFDKSVYNAFQEMKELPPEVKLNADILESVLAAKNKFEN